MAITRQTLADFPLSIPVANSKGCWRCLLPGVHMATVWPAHVLILYNKWQGGIYMRDHTNMGGRTKAFDHIFHIFYVQNNVFRFIAVNQRFF